MQNFFNFYVIYLITFEYAMSQVFCVKKSISNLIVFLLYYIILKLSRLT